VKQARRVLVYFNNHPYWFFSTERTNAGKSDGKGLKIK